MNRDFKPKERTEDELTLIRLSEEMTAKQEEIKKEFEKFEDNLGNIEDLEDGNTDYYEEYDDMLDDCYNDFEVGSMSYSPSKTFKAVDEIAYNVGYDDYVDGKIGDLENECEEIEEEINELEEEIDEELNDK